MTEIKIRKKTFILEELNHDGGPTLQTPILTGVAAAVIKNPFAGQYVEDIAPFMDVLKPLGIELSNELLEKMNVKKEAIESFGKAAIVGVNGEMEHAALWHVPGGLGLKEVLGRKGFVPSAKMLGTVGSRLMIPLLYVETVWVRSHYGVTELTIQDAPKPNELVVAVAMSTGGRVHARIGGLTKEAAERGERPAS